MIRTLQVIFQCSRTHELFFGRQSRLAFARAPFQKRQTVLFLNQTPVLTGCWLAATGQAPEERTLLSGETMEQT